MNFYSWFLTVLRKIGYTLCIPHRSQPLSNKLSECQKREFISLLLQAEASEDCCNTLASGIYIHRGMAESLSEVFAVFFVVF